MSTALTPQLTTAVRQVSAIAHAKLPQELHGRLERATAFVLHGMIRFDAQGLCEVQSSDRKRWHTVNGSCSCDDYFYAHDVDYFCKHRLARAIYRRAWELVAAQTPRTTEAETPDTSPALDANLGHPDAKQDLSPQTPLYEAPASVTVKLTIAGHKDILFTMRDADETRLLARLEALLQRFPVATAPAPEAKQCPRHQVPMKLNHGKDGKSWWSHKTAEGWCKGR